MTEDLSGLPTSLSPDLIGDWNRVILGILSHAASTGPNLNALLAAAPDFALGQAIRGLSCLLLGRAEMIPVARQAYGAALQGAPATMREIAFVHALGDWLGGRPTRAAARVQAMLTLHPHDALAMKMIQAIHFVMGRPGAMRASVEGVLSAWVDHPARGYLLGCHAFALEETGEYARAEATGRAGVELARDDAWGLHAVAHVYDMTGRARAGLDWLSGREVSWSHCNNFRFHVWWHRALMHLDLGEYDTALAHYDADIRAEKTDDYRDISNAASLLSRLELEGVDVGARWEELADLAENRASDGCLAFADLHYMLALCGGAREKAAAGLIARMHKTQAAGNESLRVIAHPGLHIARGLQAFAGGEYSTAWMHLRAGRGDLQQIGGSHAQRDIFDRITIEAALRGGYMDAADGLLRDRLTRRGGALDGYAAARLSLIDAARALAV
ncbi:tetratricopeptide repeat-containing protein [Gemmobacter aquarius]|uniref:Tetratricopeptide repeat protein 38 n=1 Tax=Paragemmobacter aquarius TaxID=2169400 RepID=A0A2S0URG4_9RHOB|nr:tetratricopeptide repeat protein [Gemmobacter aquarius]AWB50401.1 tetratricopeptide repeat-containing protein [Gemmobacter aquarius]